MAKSAADLHTAACSQDARRHVQGSERVEKKGFVLVVSMAEKFDAVVLKIYTVVGITWSFPFLENKVTARRDTLSKTHVA